MFVPTSPSAGLTGTDRVRLGRLRDRCRGLIDRAHGSLARSAALLGRLVLRPPGLDGAGPDGDRPAPPVVDADVAALWAEAAAIGDRARATVERATQEMAQAAIDVARTRELRDESRLLQWAHLALGPLPPPAPACGAGGGARMKRGSEGHRPAPPGG